MEAAWQDSLEAVDPLHWGGIDARVVAQGLIDTAGRE
jgi:hypothetical protein